MKLLNSLWQLYDLGVNTKTGEEVAIKLESAKIKFPQLIYEAKLYKNFVGKPGFP